MKEQTQEACRRAQLILEAHSNIAGNEIHLYDGPSAVITTLLTDLMHYCHAKNDGESQDNSSYLDFDAMVTIAKRLFITEVHQGRFQ